MQSMILTAALSATMIAFFFAPLPTLAQGNLDIGLGYAQDLGLQNAETSDPRDMAVTIIRYIMTFLGIVAVAIILYGGFLWMTAAGNEDKVDKGKKTIIAGAIGLIVILAAFAIVTFVVNIANDAILGDL